MTTELNSHPDGHLAAREPSTPGPTPPGPTSTAAPISERDRVLLELLVHMSLRLRLRGVDLESSTGLVGRELDLIALLTASGPTSVKSLVADLGVPRSTMTAIVDRLQNRGLVERYPNPQDRRSVMLEATPAAAVALSRYRQGMLGLVSHIKKVLTEVERDEFTRLVTKMANTF
jgi:DNA-binding MarR family transcriptional regulator